MYFCVVLCIVCAYMCTVRLPPGGYPIAAKYIIPIIIIIIIIFLHGLGRLTCSGIDAFPSFPRASTISSSSRFVVEGTSRKSGVVHSSKMVDQVLLCLGLTSCIPEISISFVITSLLSLSSLVYPLTLLRKRISAASRRVMSRVMVTNFSLPQSSVGLATTL